MPVRMENIFLVSSNRMKTSLVYIVHIIANNYFYANKFNSACFRHWAKHSHSFLAIRICNLAIFPTVHCAGDANKVLLFTLSCFHSMSNVKIDLHQLSLSVVRLRLRFRISQRYHTLVSEQFRYEFPIVIRSDVCEYICLKWRLLCNINMQMKYTNKIIIISP